MSNRLVRLLGVALTAAALSYSCTALPGGQPPGITKLTESRYSDIAWSPDGGRILGLAFLLPDDTNRLIEVPVGDHQTRVVTEDPDQFSLPSWSPQGLSAAVTVDVGEIWKLDVSTSSVSYLTQGEGAVFSPRGNEIVVFASNLTDPELDQPELRFVDLQGNVIRKLPLGLGREVGTGWYLTGLSLAPDGKKLLVSLVDFNADPDEYKVYIADTQSGEVEMALPDEQAISAKWSPDGSRLAYIRPVESLNLGELVVADTRGKCLLRPDLPPQASTVTWSPDGGRIAFLSWGAIYILDLDAFDTSGVVATGCK